MRSRQKKGVDFEGMVAVLKEGAAEAVDSKTNLLSMRKIIIGTMDKIDNKLDRMNNSIDCMLQASDQQRCSGCPREGDNYSR